MIPLHYADGPSRSNTGGTGLNDYFRRIVHWRQMDFEYTFWQMWNLIYDPSAVFRNVKYHKQTKNQWARDDPAFVVVLMCFMLVSSLAFCIAFQVPGLYDILRIMLGSILVDFLGFGLIMASMGWSVSNKYLKDPSPGAHSVDQDVEWVANVGDSRAVVGRRSSKPEHMGRLVALELTNDQRPDCPAEMERILQAGGYISPEDSEGPCRIYETKDKSEGGLTLARAIGDFSLEPVGVICDPEVIRYQVSPADQLVVLGSDGIFEFIDSQEVVELASQHPSASRACTELVKEAMHRWCPDESKALYRDDITAAVLHLPLWVNQDKLHEPRSPAGAILGL